MSKPNVIILGGVGFIGRNFVKYLVDEGVAGHVRVVDKVLPSTAFLGEIHQKAFDAENVEYMQGNLNSAASIENCFSKGDVKFDYAVCLAAETKYGQTTAVYEEKVVDLAKKVGEAAKKHGVKKFVYFSTAQVYAEGKSGSKETDKLEPWTELARYSLQAEEALKGMDLPLVILRPAIVYGPGDVQGISPRLICAAVYKYQGKKMQFLWTKDLRLHTVHVRDVVAATWLCCEKAEPGKLYNLADSNDTTQGTVNGLLEDIFGIKTGFKGTAVSSLAKQVMDQATEQINDKHLKPWSDLCKEKGILNTPLTPYLDKELLFKNALGVDGSLITKDLGFKYSEPKMTADLLREQIDYFAQQQLYPPL